MGLANKLYRLFFTWGIFIISIEGFVHALILCTVGRNDEAQLVGFNRHYIIRNVFCNEDVYHSLYAQCINQIKNKQLPHLRYLFGCRSRATCLLPCR